jgi:queuine tRNA-ribosyltransferase
MGIDVLQALDLGGSVARAASPEESLRLRIEWARRSLDAMAEPATLLAVLPVSAGAEVVRELGRLPFDGYVLDGLEESAPPERGPVLERALAEIPPTALRVVDWRGGLLGLNDLVAAGVDLVRLPAEAGRAAARRVLARSGEVDASKDDWLDDTRPLEPGCRCPTCRRLTRAYVRHLAVAGELLACRLIELHNLVRLSAEIRSR